MHFVEDDVGRGVESVLNRRGVNTGIVKSEKGAIAGFSNGRVVTTVRRRSHMRDHRHQFVVHVHAPHIGPPDMLRNIQLSSHGHRPTILSSHKIESFKLDTQHERRSLNFVLFPSRHLLFALFALVHVLSLAQHFLLKVPVQSLVNVICLSDV